MPPLGAAPDANAAVTPYKQTRDRFRVTALRHGAVERWNGTHLAREETAVRSILKKSVWPLVAITLGASALVGAARSGPPPRLTVRVDGAHQGAHAGYFFTGVSVVNLEPGSTVINWVKCDGHIGTRTIVARKHRLFDQVGRLGQITCSWRIPSGTVGQVLRTSVITASSNRVQTDDRHWLIAKP